jgi:methyltransferase (TIGR00027 family)
MTKPSSVDPQLTAFAIARVRSDEWALPESERLFSDPYAYLFDDAKIEVDPVFDLIPFFRQGIRLRTRFIDECVRSALAEGATHVVIVGAGFDTRALRMPEIAQAGARVIEVDQAPQIALKRARFRRAGVSEPSHLAFVAADLALPEIDRSLPASLRAAGLPGSASVLWICEGLLGYLSRDMLEQLFAATRAASGPRSTLVANHTEWVWSRAVLSDLLARNGWTATPTPGFDELHRQWIGPEVPTGSDGFSFMLARR